MAAFIRPPAAMTTGQHPAILLWREPIRTQAGVPQPPQLCRCRGSVDHSTQVVKQPRLEFSGDSRHLPCMDQA